MQHEIETLLTAGTIRKEQGLRAGSSTVLLQSAIYLRRVELYCADVAVIKGIDKFHDAEANDALRFADGDLNSAGACYRSVLQRYLKPLAGRDMRRERVARRLHSLLTGHFRSAFERDTGVNDIRQELREAQATLQELRGAIRIYASDYLSRALTAVKDYFMHDDAALVLRIAEIIDFAIEKHVDPADENYPVLVWRMWPIRAKFAELPAWHWSTSWTAYCAVIQAWLYLFAATGAKLAGDTEAAAQFLSLAFTASNFASTMIVEVALLDGFFKPWLTALSMHGRQKVIRGFDDPPDREQLRELLDEIQIRLTAQPRGNNDRFD